MQLRYVFTELRQGLRRNLSMHIAVVLTLFVSLTLVGIGVLLNKQADKAAEHLGNQLQITVCLCKDARRQPACTGEVTDAQKEQIEEAIEDNPEVEDYQYESKRWPSRRSRSCLGAEKFEGPNPAATADDMAESYWVTLKDPDESDGITSAVSGLDGVSRIRDVREVLEPVFTTIEAHEVGRAGHRGDPGARRAAAGRQHDPAGGVGPAQGDRHHAAGRRLDASTSRCRSCSRRWSPRSSASRSAGGALAAFM